MRRRDIAAAYPMLCRECGMTGHVGGNTPPDDCPSCGATNIRTHPDLFDLTIAHIDCDAFYASIEKRDNPALADRPVIVGGGQRGVVAAACYIARQYGVRSAMPAWQALRKCPDAVVIRPRMAHYIAVSRQIRRKMLSLTPLVQPLSIDEAFLDLGGTRRLHRASPAEMLHRLQGDIAAEIGITVSVGLAANKSMAKMASDADKPNGFYVIGRGDAASWLAPQPVSVLYGIGRAAVARLNSAGITTCGDLVGADIQIVKLALGSQAQRVRHLASGIDPRPVSPERAVKSVSTETTFTVYLSLFEDLEAELESLFNSLSSRLKAKSLAGKTITLKLKSATHRSRTRSRTVSHPVDKAYMLFDIGRELLRPETRKSTRYRLLGIGVSNFVTENWAPELALDDIADHRRRQLEDACDKLQERLGRDIVQTGRQFSRRKNLQEDD